MDKHHRAHLQSRCKTAFLAAKTSEDAVLATMTDRAYAFTINQVIEKSAVDSLISESNSIEDAVYKPLSPWRIGERKDKICIRQPSTR